MRETKNSGEWVPINFISWLPKYHKHLQKSKFGPDEDQLGLTSVAYKALKRGFLLSKLENVEVVEKRVGYYCKVTTWKKLKQLTVFSL